MYGNGCWRYASTVTELNVAPDVSFSVLGPHIVGYATTRYHNVLASFACRLY